MDDMQKWLMSIFATCIVLFNAWVARSIAQLKKENADQALKMAENYASTAAIREMRQEMKEDMGKLRDELQTVAQLLQRYIGESHARRD